LPRTPRRANEWKKLGPAGQNVAKGGKLAPKEKQPYAIALADRSLMALAGLWETCLAVPPATCRRGCGSARSASPEPDRPSRALSVRRTDRQFAQQRRTAGKQNGRRLSSVMAGVARLDPGKGLALRLRSFEYLLIGVVLIVHRFAGWLG
jgi:hypothetical protein